MTTTRTTPVNSSPLRLLAALPAAAGAWLAIMPFALSLPRRYPHALAFWCYLIAGAVVAMLSSAHAFAWRDLRAASHLSLAIGLLVALSPALIGYTKYLNNGGTVAVVAVVTGLVIAAGALMSLVASKD